MILKPSPIRKSPASLHAALRALMVSACALTTPTVIANSGSPRRSVSHWPASTASTPYLALLAPTPMRFAAPARPPVVLEIEPLPEAEPASPNPAADSSATTTAPLADFTDLKFPTTTQLDDAIAQVPTATAPSPNKTTPGGPPPILLSDDPIPGARPEDILPFFRLPSLPSSATYQKQ